MNENVATQARGPQPMPSCRSNQLQHEAPDLRLTMHKHYRHSGAISKRFSSMRRAQASWR